jgi:ABC transporter fused permease/ATP-binding protein
VTAPYVDDEQGDRPRDRRRLSVLWRLTALMRPYRARFAFAALMLLAASAITLVYPMVGRFAVDQAMAKKTSHDLNMVAGIVIAMALVNAAFVWLRHYSLSWLGERVVTDLRGLVFDQLLTLPLAWFHERRTGELTGRLASDVTVIEGVVSTELSLALRNGVQIVGALVMLFVIDVELTLAMLAIVPPIVLTTIWFGRRIRAMQRDVRDELANVSGQVQEAIGAISTVQGFVREPHETRRYRGGIEAAFRRTMVMMRWRASFLATAMSTGYIGVVAVVWLGGRAMIAGELSPGAFLEFFLYTFTVVGALADLSSVWEGLQRAAGATERLFAVIDTVPDVRDPDDAKPLPDGRGAIRFEGVSFAYPARRGQPVLTEVNLEIRPGEVIALVGPSGSGKSTILSLLFRFYDVDGGRVLFEGVDVRELKLELLRRCLAMVAQEPVLFSGTIRDNIAYSCDDATPYDIEQAARDANAHDFITGFPDGYGTVIGERGTKLSGGQKQRIALARALLANPRVLILDEATSNLDAESEAAVQAALARIMENRTTIIVAHRLSTVRNADRIVVIEGSRVVEQGGHDELMELRGTYRRLVEHQLIADAS